MNCKQKKVEGRELRVERRWRVEVRIPQSAFRLPHSAITLIEVLISMGILTIGLLGVAAIFPVGGHYMRKGEEADRGAAIAKAAFGEVVARGMLNPDLWMTHITDGQFSNSDVPFGDRFRPALLQYRRNRDSNFDAANPAMEAQAERDGNALFGSAVVIDPLAVAHVLERNANSALNISQFPAIVNPIIRYDAVDDTRASWRPWQTAAPVRRLSLAMPVTDGGLLPIGTPVYLSSDAADAIFRSNDDLAMRAADSDDEPTRQLWSRTADGTTLARQSRGNYTWLVTIAPTSNAARDALATDPSKFYYNVSVVVFNKRVLDDFDANSTSSEKYLRGRVISKSLSGGELLLEPVSSITNDRDLFENLKPGQWIMVFGPHTRSRSAEPALFLRWYRVLAVEGEEEQLDASGAPTTSAPDPANPRRLVALRGPAWPWEPAGNTDTSNLPNDVRVAIVPNAVAVHSRDMRLESESVWSVD